MDNNAFEIFITLVVAFITTVVTYHIFYSEKAMQMKEKQLMNFYYPALKRLKKCLGKDPESPEVKKEFEEILNCAIKNEYLLDNKTKCAICKMHAVHTNRYVAKDKWNLCYECNTPIIIDKEIFFHELYNIIRINSYYLGESINWPIENIKPNNPVDKSWMKKKKIKKFLEGLKIYIINVAILLSLYFIIEYFFSHVMELLKG